uniref:BPTI/Kunitz inhibitor domain-containing protein n=1 Tax=Pseudonaja textilis TaxID=8673 RepID=A0A670Z337_PSETE
RPVIFHKNIKEEISLTIRWCSVSISFQSSFVFHSLFQKFLYGGCGGNANNFKTIKECESTCAGK